MTGWPGVSTGVLGFCCEGLAGDGHLRAVDEAGVDEAFGEEARAAGL